MMTNKGIVFALMSAALFGASAPFAKLLLSDVGPWLLAGLLYMGSGVGLTLMRLVWRKERARLAVHDWSWLLGAIVIGGVVAPVLLMYGLVGATASTSSLLLNAEGVFTAVLAWVVFGENADRRIILGMVSIVAGAVWLSWPGGAVEAVWPSLAVLGACLCWAIDNNLTRKVSLADPLQIATLKGTGAGVTNIAIAIALGASWPTAETIGMAGLVGFFGYGLSLAAFVLALRELGTARTGAYFSTAPFVGAVIAVVLLGEPLTMPLLGAAALMGMGVWLHLSERHEHVHQHSVMEHAHDHAHDEHHAHDHVERQKESPDASHMHWHRHEPLTHSHSHYPDAHHRHDHG